VVKRLHILEFNGQMMRQNAIPSIQSPDPIKAGVAIEFCIPGIYFLVCSHFLQFSM
jgi:hypothetical protein